MDLGLAGKRALIGGGAAGIGHGIATALAAEGASVALLGRTRDRVQAAATTLNGHAVIADLANEDGPASAVFEAIAALGGLDLLVANTGGPPPGEFEVLDDTAWATAIDGTLLSGLRLVRAALPHLRTGNDPAILINLSSSVREPIPALTTSNVLRPGLAGLIKTLTAEIAPIRINGLAPGRIATDRIAFLDGRRAEAANTSVEDIQRQMKSRIPLGRYGDIAEIGRVAEGLRPHACAAEVVDEAARRVTVPVADATGMVPVVVRQLDEAGLKVADVGIRRPTLDDVFLELTGHVAETEEVEVA